jgi:hypothetical protein
MFGLSEAAFLIPENIDQLQSGTYIFKKYKIPEEDELKLQCIIAKSILFSDEIKKQNAVCIKGLMVILDLFKMYNISVDDNKQADYKTTAMVENIFKYIIDSISAASDTAEMSTVSDTAEMSTAEMPTAEKNLKCIIARIFYNKRKMLFFILLLIIGVEYYEKGGYTFKTGGGRENCNNFANKLYKLMHEFFFGPIISKNPNSKCNAVRPPNKRKVGRPQNNHKVGRSSNKHKVDDDSEEYIAPNKRNCNRDNTTTTRQTRSSGCIISITELSKYDSEIFNDPLLQNGIDLNFPSNIFGL